MSFVQCILHLFSSSTIYHFRAKYNVSILCRMLWYCLVFLSNVWHYKLFVRHDDRFWWHLSIIQLSYFHESIMYKLYCLLFILNLSWTIQSSWLWTCFSMNELVYEFILIWRYKLKLNLNKNVRYSVGKYTAIIILPCIQFEYIMQWFILLYIDLHARRNKSYLF